jgi:hypothetical protein
MYVVLTMFGQERGIEADFFKIENNYIISTKLILK